MKRNKIWMTGLPVIMMALLSGCGAELTGTGDVTIQGKAIDPYLSGATVCVDVNKNRVCDSTEVSVTTDANGSYTLTVSHKDLASGPAVVLVTGGTDIATGEHFNGTLTALADANHTTVHITPLTSVEVAHYHRCHADINATGMTAGCEHTSHAGITHRVAAYFDLNTTEVEGDIVALANAHHTRALKVALALETLAENNTSAFYDRVSQKIGEASDGWENDLDDIDHGARDLVDQIMDIHEADVEGEANCTAHGIAVHVHAHTHHAAGTFPWWH